MMCWFRKKPTLSVDELATKATNAWCDLHRVNDPCERAWVRLHIREVVIPRVKADEA